MVMDSPASADLLSLYDLQGKQQLRCLVANQPGAAAADVAPHLSAGRAAAALPDALRAEPVTSACTMPMWHLL